MQRLIGLWQRFGQVTLGLGVVVAGATLAAFDRPDAINSQLPPPDDLQPLNVTPGPAKDLANELRITASFGSNGRPVLSPLPQAQEVWQCEVVVVGGSLGGVGAAVHAMQSGARTCVIEVSPWIGGQISTQGVSAIDESADMILAGNLSESWKAFKSRIYRQPVKIPRWADRNQPIKTVREVDSCWVGSLCFPASAGDVAAREALAAAAQLAPGSRWSSATAFKGAAFDATGHNITAIYAVRRTPRADYVPSGRLSQELPAWYSWNSDDTFRKTPIRLEPVPGKRFTVIDATDTGELVAWARVPHRLGSESRRTLGEPNAANWDNPQCTQAFTFPFVVAIANDEGRSLKQLGQLQPTFPKHEHQRTFSLWGFPPFLDRSFFKYRRIVSMRLDNRITGKPSPGDMAMINWGYGNNWNLMNPPLILTGDRLMDTDQYRNWMGGVSTEALHHGEERALIFSEWVLKTLATKEFPLMHLAGPNTPMGTRSGLSLMPYIREGRRILGRSAYRQNAFMIRENDVHRGIENMRDFSATSISMVHYDIDIQGCAYRNWEDPGEATNASADIAHVRPVAVPIEALIPRGVDNLLIGGKAIAVSHIVNGVTRIHYSEWSSGAAAGSIAGWLQRQPKSLIAAEIVPQNRFPSVREHMKAQGLRWWW